jgi:hypothetical protein
MRTIPFIILLALVLPWTTSAKDTNEVTLVAFKVQGADWECTVSEEQIQADTKWDITKTAIPLEPKKAYDISARWMQERFKFAGLVRMEILPLGTRSPKLQDHYCYIVEFLALGGREPYRASVVVLMNGTLIPPKQVAH